MQTVNRSNNCNCRKREKITILVKFFSTIMAMFFVFSLFSETCQASEVEDILPELEPVLVEEVVYTEQQIAVAKTIEREAPWLPLDEQVAVGLTIFNRMQSPLFPNSAMETVSVKGQYKCADTFSEKSMIAALEAEKIYLARLSGQEIETSIWTLPDNYFYFFGYAGHNWFYRTENKKVIFFQMPGIEEPKELREQYKKIVLKKVDPKTTHESSDSENK